jgi:tetratricopeptide (TPR) repeat protein
MDHPLMRRLLPPLLLALAGTAAYLNSFRVPFIFDDRSNILDNPHLRALWPLSETLRPPIPRCTVDGRPLISLTLALNYAAGGLDPRGYHLVNLIIHLAAGLLLYGIVRRTLHAVPEAPWLALGTAAIWLLHPLQTESVTYIIQRAESLMGLFYLLTLYAALRDWKALAVLSSVLGMATKEVMVTAPLAVLLYDRAYRAGSFRKAWRQRKGFYLALAATWGVLAVCVAWGSQTQGAGFTFHEITPFLYACSQCGVVLHYLRLALWPSGLVLDYAWPVAREIQDWLPQGLGILALLIPTLRALWKNHPLGFPAFFFFLVLAPTSSIMPIRDLAFEHRMYLPLAGVAALAILGGRHLAGRLGLGGLAQGLLLLAACGGLWTATVLRNRDYRSNLALWADAAFKRPTNPRAQCETGSYLLPRHPDLAIPYFREAIRLEPDFAFAYHNLGNALASKGDLEGAIAAISMAHRLSPGNPTIRRALATLVRERVRQRTGIPPGPPGPFPGPGPDEAAPPPLPDGPAPSPPSP